MDKLSPARRSANMRAIRSKGMKPELIVRRAVYGLGYRYRLHLKTLAGKPDLVFRKRRKVIFVHGCFWHQHERCKVTHLPGSNEEYWYPKLARNVSRDLEHVAKLEAEGWAVLVIWECEVKNEDALALRIRAFLG